jgi:hypothetical protein
MHEEPRRKHLRTAMAAVGIAFIAPAVATPSAATLTSPACTAKEYHQLDFWIGDWDTFETDTAGGPSIARARVEPIAQGCAIHELYEQADGLVGDSILSYDPVRKQWQQTWVTNRGSIMVLWGNFNDGALILEGEAHICGMASRSCSALRGRSRIAACASQRYCRKTALKPGLQHSTCCS